MWQWHKAQQILSSTNVKLIRQVMMSRGIQMAWFTKKHIERSHFGAISPTTHDICGNTWFLSPLVLHLKHSVMAIARADDVTVALQWLEDQLQRRLAHVEAVALPDCRQDVQDVATLLRIWAHRRKRQQRLKTHRSTRRHVGNTWRGGFIGKLCSISIG